jgi:hypothetical protein
VRLAPNSTGGDRAVLSHQLVAEVLEEFARIFLDCSSRADQTDRITLSFAKITAIRVDGALSNRPSQ